MTIAYFSGFETGDTSELAIVGGAVVQNAIVHPGGAYALQGTSSATKLVGGLTATSGAVRIWFYTRQIPTSGASVILREVSGVGRLRVEMTTAGKLQASDVGVTLGLVTTVGTAVLLPNTWYLVETAYDLAAGGIIRIWVNGVLEVDTTHSSDVTGTPTESWQFLDFSGLGFTIDDVRVDVATTQRIGSGICIARQGTAGTPTYDAWTKTGAATSALCWSATPFATGANCSTSTQNNAQTMLVAPFSSTQTGHGIGILLPGDKINSCKVGTIAKTASAGNTSIRRRVNGSDTDTSKAITTSDAYYETAIFTDSPTNLDAYEIGAVNNQVATLQTVEDMWLMVDFTPVRLMGQIVY